MRILFLTPQLPYPPHQGTSIRNYNLIKNLAMRHEVHLLSFVHSIDELARAAPLRECCREIEVVLAPRRSTRQRFFSFFLSSKPDIALRLPSKEFETRLAAALQRKRFDVLQVEGIEMGPYLEQGARIREQGGKPLIVFDDHNAEYILQRRAFETDVRYILRWVGAFYSLVQWRKLGHYEAALCRLADRVIAVSEADRWALQRLVPGLEVAVVPNGVDTEFYNDQFPMTNDQSRFGHWDLVIGHYPLVFTGKMDFRPNVDAVLWFYRQVLPLIRREIPDVHFYVVGRSPHRRILRLGEDPAVTVTGYVDDVRPYIAGAKVYVVPLRIGGGTRLKVLEAMAMGKAIVSTSLGCEGFQLKSGRELIIADKPERFALEVIGLLRDAPLRERLGRAARRFVKEHYDWRFIVPRLEQVYTHAGL